MPQPASDPLLTAARVIIVIAQVVIIVALAGLCIAAAAMVFAHGEVSSELAKEGVPASAYWAILGALALAAAILMLWERFVAYLRRIVDSVGAGDPFAPENADRLSRMGWMALSVFALSLPLGALGTWIASRVEQGTLDIDFGGGGSGLVLAVVLFILARVFRHGAAMREELEGTV
jgi:hypothetical protein